MFKLSKRSESNLAGVNADLVRVVRRAIQISEVDFSVIEGLRAVERQRDLVAKGASRTMRSKHLTGHAVDCAPWVNGSIPWNDWDAFESVANAMKAAAKELNIKIEWGGDWKTFKDGPHFELT